MQISQDTLNPKHSHIWIALAIMLTYSVIWFWHVNSVSLVIPGDNIEQLVWVHSLEWGYYKHPPFPTWFLWIFVQLFGWKGVVSTLLGATLTMASMGVMYVMSFKAGGRSFALIALLAALCVTFYNARIYYYNHNVVMMLWVALSAYVFLQILQQTHLKWWFALGIIGGFAMLTKYQFVLLAAPMSLLYLHQRLWQIPLHRKGLCLALLLALLIFSPHLYWLLHHPEGPIEYAFMSSLSENMGLLKRLGHTLNWTADWLLNRCILAIILILLCAWGLRPKNDIECNKVSPCREAQNARLIILLWGLLPLVLMAGLGLFTGARLQLHWGTAFALWTVPAVMLLFRLDTIGAPDARMWRWLVAPFLLIQAALLVVSYETSSFGHFGHKAKGISRQTPIKEMAKALASATQEELGGPIRLLVGEQNICGALSLELPEKPKVLIDGKPEISPWVTSEDLQSKAKIWIWHKSNAPPNARLLLHKYYWSLQPQSDP